MKLYLLLPGVLLALTGAIFTLQGLGMVGPSSSFMFRSGAWVEDGLLFFFIGVGLSVGGVLSGRQSSAAPARG